MAATLLTALSMVVFGVAMVMGVRTVIFWPFFKAATTYMTLVAAGNFAFRGWTLWMRLHEHPFPEPFTTNSALVNQVALATALAVGVSLGYFRAKAIREHSSDGGY